MLPNPTQWSSGYLAVIHRNMVDLPSVLIEVTPHHGADSWVMCHRNPQSLSRDVTENVPLLRSCAQCRFTHLNYTIIIIKSLFYFRIIQKRKWRRRCAVASELKAKWQCPWDQSEPRRSAGNCSHILWTSS